MKTPEQLSAQQTKMRISQLSDSDKNKLVQTIMREDPKSLKGHELRRPENLANFVATDNCRCGRGLKPHCPNCGSVAFTATNSRAGIRCTPSGVSVFSYAYRCRRCGTYFDDIQWVFSCEAPKFIAGSMKQVRALDVAQNQLRQMAFNPATRGEAMRLVAQEVERRKREIAKNSVEAIPRASDDKGASPLDQNPFANDEGNPVGDGE